MFKKFVIALAGLFVMLGLAATPASAASANTLDMWILPGQIGSPQASVSNVPTACTEVPTTVQVRSALNNTATSVAFFADTDCQVQVATLAANGGRDDGVGNNLGTIGALSYRAAA